MKKKKGISHWVGPRRAEYNTFIARVKSFKDRPEEKNPTPVSLSEAGFFFDGKFIINENFVNSGLTSPDTYNHFSLQVGMMELFVSTVAVLYMNGFHQTILSANMHGSSHTVSISGISKDPHLFVNVKNYRKTKSEKL
jgi:hypothetical protein